MVARHDTTPGDWLVCYDSPVERALPGCQCPDAFAVTAPPPELKRRADVGAGVAANMWLVPDRAAIVNVEHTSSFERKQLEGQGNCVAK